MTLPEGFDPGYYLMLNGDVDEAGMDAADHYLRFGRAEGRRGVPPELSHFDDRYARGRADFFVSALSAVAMNGIPGPYLEFGVGRGVTMWLAHRISRSLGLEMPLWGFDSFEGLPAGTDQIDTSHPSWLAGRYAHSFLTVRRNLERMDIDPDGINWVHGFYSESVAPERRATLPDHAAFVYIDCDMYSSTKDALSYVGGILRHGTIIGFDDYFCWSPERRSGEQIALEELKADRPDLTFNPYLPIGWHGMSFFVSTD